MYLCNEVLHILLVWRSLLEHLILTNVLTARYTFIAISVVIIICICCCRLLDIEHMFYINA